MAEKQWQGGTAPLVDDLGDGSHVPVVKVLGGVAGGGTPAASLTDDQLRATPVPVSTGASAGQGAADASTQRVTIASDDALLGRLPAAVTPGLLPVDTLARPTLARILASTSAAASVALTASCRRISMFATQNAWYSLTGASATAGAAGGASSATSHFIAAGERLDFDVLASTTISVLRETTDGQVRITELA